MNVKRIRRYLSDKVGCKIRVVYYGSRGKKEFYKGVIYNAYANVFIIKLFTGEIRCFNYIDILTKSIQVYIEQ